MSLEFDKNFDTVKWEDTDESEDEDYLPSFDKQLCTSVDSSISNSSFEELFRLNKQEHGSPTEIVRRVVDRVVDNGIEKVDLGDIGLTDIPKEVGDLEYVTILRKDVVKTASLQLYLYGNRLSCLNSNLFRLKNLTVLSLRHNQLTSIPPDISLLVNLVELSLGNNQLKTLPAELQRLPKLTTLSLFPNPYLTDKSEKPIISLPSLVELCNRTILSNSIHPPSILPDTIHNFSNSKASTCENCRSLFYLPSVYHVRWVSVLGNQPIPFVYRFCSIPCSK